MLIRSIFRQSPVFYVPIRIPLTPLANNYRSPLQMPLLPDCIFISIRPINRGPIRLPSTRGISILGRTLFATIHRRKHHRFNNISFCDCVLFSPAIWRAFDSFGRAFAQFINFGLMIRQSIVDSHAVSISCDQHIRSKLSTLSRERGRIRSIILSSLAMTNMWPNDMGWAPPPKGNRRRESMVNIRLI